MPLKKHPLIHRFTEFPMDQCMAGSDKVSDGHGYTLHYEEMFSPLKNKPIRLLELGLGPHCPSLKGWAKYFPQAKIYGIDINPDCAQFSTDRVSITIGNLSSTEFCDQYIHSLTESFDIIIEDASHHVDQQKLLFSKFFPVVKDGGIYVVEDLGTSYWPGFGGSLKGNNTMIEFLKDLVDHPNHEMFKHNQYVDYPEVYHAETKDMAISYLDCNIYSLHFYRECCFVYKGSYR